MSEYKLEFGKGTKPYEAILKLTNGCSDNEVIHLPQCFYYFEGNGDDRYTRWCSLQDRKKAYLDDNKLTVTKDDKDQIKLSIKEYGYDGNVEDFILQPADIKGFYSIDFEKYVDNEEEQIFIKPDKENHNEDPEKWIPIGLYDNDDNKVGNLNDMSVQYFDKNPANIMTVGLNHMEYYKLAELPDVTLAKGHDNQYQLKNLTIINHDNLDLSDVIKSIPCVKIEKLNSEVNELTQEKNQLQAEKEDLSGQLSKLTGQNNELTQEKNQLQAEKEDLSGQLSKLTGQNNELTQEKNRLQAEKEDLSGQLSKLTGQNNELTQEKNQLQAEKEGLSSQFIKLAEQSKALCNEFYQIQLAVNGTDHDCTNDIL